MQPNPKVIKAHQGGRAGRQLELFLVDVKRDAQGNVLALYHGEVATVEVDGVPSPDVQGTFEEYLQEEALWALRLAQAEEVVEDELAEDSDEWQG